MLSRASSLERWSVGTSSVCSEVAFAESSISDFSQRTEHGCKQEKQYNEQGLRHLSGVADVGAQGPERDLQGRTDAVEVDSDNNCKAETICDSLHNSTGNVASACSKYHHRGAGISAAVAQMAMQNSVAVGRATAALHNSSKFAMKAIRINLGNCKYSVLRVVSKKLGWVEVADDVPWDVCWTDTSSGTDRLIRMRRPQKLNHFPGMLELARKKSLARNLANMAAVYPRQYSFFPKTFLLPEMTDALMAEFGRGKGKKTFIMKLDNGSQGRGIKLVQSAAAALAAIPTFEHENIVASQYIANPFLVNGYKFDLRIYVLVRSCDPLRVFVHKEGLARFCTEKYQRPTPANIANNYSHLTNYSLNKHNPSFIFNSDAQQAADGSKWSINALGEWMRAQGHDWGAVWISIKHLIVKSLIAIQPMLQYLYRSATRPDDDGFSCFEVLGYDVLLDDTLQPWLIEVNHSPSFTTDTPLDLAIKERVITDAMHLVGIKLERFKEELAAREAARVQRLYSHATTSPTAAAAMHIPPVRPGAQQTLLPARPSPVSLGCTSSLSCSQQPQQCKPQPASPASAPSLQLQVEVAQHHPSGRAEVEGAATPGGGALAEAEEEGAEWEAAQREHENVNMGLFQRILPNDDPEQQALYEELLAGAQQVFFKQTMQGRVQHALIQIKERRQQEEAEAAARELAHKRRVESLKAWMANQCIKAREERRRQQHTGGFQRNQHIRALHAGQSVDENQSGLQCDSSAANDGAEINCSRGQSQDSLEYRSSSFEIDYSVHAGGRNLRKRAEDREGSGQREWRCTCSCHLHEPGDDMHMQSTEELNIRGVKTSVQSAREKGTRPAHKSPQSPPSAASLLKANSKPPVQYAWGNKPGRQLEHTGCGKNQGPVQQCGTVPYSPGLGSGRFVRRMASLHQGAGPAACIRRSAQGLAQAQRCREGHPITRETFGRDSSSSGDVEEEGEGNSSTMCSQCGDRLCDGSCEGGQEEEAGGQEAALGATSTPTSPKSPGTRGVCNGASGYISPGMASALHGAPHSAQLLHGWPAPHLRLTTHPLGPHLAAARQRLSPTSCGGASPPAPSSPSSLVHGRTPWEGKAEGMHARPGDCRPAEGVCKSFSRRRRLTPVAAYGRSLQAHAFNAGVSRRPLAQEQQPSARQERSHTPGVNQLASSPAQGVCSRGSPDGAELLRVHSRGGQVARPEYIREIEKQAVKSIAEMIADVLGQ